MSHTIVIKHETKKGSTCGLTACIFFFKNAPVRREQQGEETRERKRRGRRNDEKERMTPVLSSVEILNYT